MLQHGVEDREQLAHTGDEGDLLGFADSEEAMIEDLEDRIIASASNYKCYEIADF